MERHHGAQGKARHDNERQRFVAHFCELTSQLSKLEGRLHPIYEDSQTGDSYFSDKLEESTEPSHAVSPFRSSHQGVGHSSRAEPLSRSRERETPRSRTT